MFLRYINNINVLYNECYTHDVHSWWDRVSVSGCVSGVLREPMLNLCTVSMRVERFRDLSNILGQLWINWRNPSSF